MINVLEAQNIVAEYETLKIDLPDGKSYIPDWVSHHTRTIYEVKYEKALTQPKIQVKIAAGKTMAVKMGYAFEIHTERNMRVLTYDEVVNLVREGVVVVHAKKNAGCRLQKLLRLIAPLSIV